MKFIGRKAELAKLNAEYERDGSFVVIYGRRRVGKTTLIKEFLKKKTAFYFLATEELETQSMKRLAGVIARTTKNSLLQKASFSDWMDMFQVIADYEPEQKKVLVIDEFPYLVKTNPAFPSILQNAWDELLKDSNIMLILSGSLIGMMQNTHCPMTVLCTDAEPRRCGWLRCLSQRFTPFRTCPSTRQWNNMP